MSLIDDIWDITPTGIVINAITKETYGPAFLNMSDQAANIDAIDRFFAEAQPINSKAASLKDDWMQWASGLSWYQKHVDESVAALAFNKRNAFMRENAPEEDKAHVDAFLKKVPAVDPVTGKVNRVTSSGDRVVPPTPLIPTQYKMAAVITGAAITAVVVLKKLYIL